MQYNNGTHVPCSNVHNVAEAKRCHWVENTADCTFGNVLIDYIPFLFCNFSYSNISFGVFTLGLFLIILFIVLGTTADEFFCPCLEVIAKVFKLSDIAAGVTILAFGNSSPDIFTSLSAIPKGHIQLIFCELIGGGIFITTVLVGTICLFFPFHIRGRVLIRDVAFYLATLAWIFFIFHKSYITLWETSGFFLLYAIYLIVVLTERRVRHSLVEKFSEKISSSDLERLRNIREANQDENKLTALSNNAGDDAENDEEQVTHILTTRDNPETNHSVDKNDGHIYTIQYMEETQSHRGHSSSSKPALESVDEQDKEEEPKDYTTKSADDELTTPLLEESKTSDKKKKRFKDFFKWKKRRTSDAATPLLGKRSRGKFVKEFLKEMHPFNKEIWKTSSCLSKTILVLKCPTIFFLKLVIPVVNIQKPIDGWCKVLSVWHSVTFPLYCCLSSGYAFSNIFHNFPLIVFILLIGLGMAIFVFLTSEKDQQPYYHNAFAFMGFMGSMFTLYFLTCEIVQLLKAVGIASRISESTLGLTVLAWGTQIGDCITIITIVRAGFIRMGFAACYGCSLFNCLLSIGLAFSLGTINSSQYQMSVNYGDMGSVCLAFLAMSLISAFIALPTMNFEARRGFGIYLYLLYAAFLLVCILNESNIINITGLTVVATKKYVTKH